MTFKMALLEILPVAMWRHTGMQGGWVKKCWVGKNKVAPSFLLVVTILDRIKWNSKPPSPTPPNQGWSQNAPFSYPWFVGEGVQFPIYFVQDCSYFDFFTYFPISSQGSPASLRATPLAVRRGCRSSRYALKCKSTTVICPLRLLSSVGRAPVCWAGVRGFKPRLGQHFRRRLHAGKHSGSLYNWEESVSETRVKAKPQRQASESSLDL